MLRQLKNNKMLQKQQTKSVVYNCYVRICFSKFRSGNKSLRNESRPGHSPDFDEDALKE